MAAARLKNETSPCLGRGLNDFNKIWHSDAVRPSWPSWPLKIKKIKIQDDGSRHLDKSKIIISRPKFRRFRRNLKFATEWCQRYLTCYLFSVSNTVCFFPCQSARQHNSVLVYAISDFGRYQKFRQVLFFYAAYRPVKWFSIDFSGKIKTRHHVEAILIVSFGQSVIIVEL